VNALVAAGDVLADKYRVEKVLGVGGMGVVVAAMHIELEQRVALKFMLPDARTSTEAIDRFVREARAAARLRNAHICKVLDVGKLANGLPYIVMEYLEGEDLSAVIERRRIIPVEELVDLILQAAEGLADAHRAGIVHRDLKPANLFVSRASDDSALVKILDFGISKVSNAVGGSATKTGQIMGSPLYMAPEQLASSKDVDHRADIWSLGVILYQAATGAVPFDAEVLPALCVEIMTGRPRQPTELPSAFANAVMRCLEKSPAARPADLGELAMSLVPFGGPQAPVAAERICRILGKIARPSSRAPSEGAAASVPSTALAVAHLRGPSTTFTASAAESLVRNPAQRTSPTRTLAIAGAAVAAAIAVVGVVTLRAKHDVRMSNGSALDEGVHPDESSVAGDALVQPAVTAEPVPPNTATPETPSVPPPEVKAVVSKTSRVRRVEHARPDAGIAALSVAAPVDAAVTSQPTSMEPPATPPLHGGRYKGTKGTIYTQYPESKE
jgi:serine/threonine-protein kinase